MTNNNQKPQGVFASIKQAILAILSAITRTANAVDAVAEVAEANAQKWAEDTRKELEKARETPDA